MNGNNKSIDSKQQNKQSSDKYGLKEFVDKNYSNINLIQNFFPFTNNNVLQIQVTKKGIFILVNNGTVITIGDSLLSNIQKNTNSKTDIPRLLTIKKQIIDIVCGNEHTIIISKDYKVYSWGSNA